MKNRIVKLASVANPIKESPGFEKKMLSEHKLDLMALCGFGCSYCSSNEGNYLRINRETFADATEAQIGERIYPKEDPALTFVWPDVLEKLDLQLANKPKSWGAGKTLVFSMLTDGFSPVLVGNGVTLAALERVLEKTSFRIRVLTKNGVVGTGSWLEFFSAHPGRFVVGLSTGTLDDAWARQVEIGTSSPSARLRALHALQDAGVPTFGMLCPVFPEAADRISDLIAATRPGRCETVWAEPYNDRANWRAVRAGYPEDSNGYRWLTDVYEHGDKRAWSAYATTLYNRLRDASLRGGWAEKLKYLLYEDGIHAEHAPAFQDLGGVLLQSKTGEDGRSRNPHIAQLQSSPEHGYPPAPLGVDGLARGRGKGGQVRLPMLG